MKMSGTDGEPHLLQALRLSRRIILWFAWSSPARGFVIKSHPFSCLPVSPDSLVVVIDAVDCRLFTRLVRFDPGHQSVPLVLSVAALYPRFLRHVFSRRGLGLWSETVSAHPCHQHDSVPISSVSAGEGWSLTPSSVGHVGSGPTIPTPVPLSACLPWLVFPALSLSSS